MKIVVLGSGPTDPIPRKGERTEVDIEARKPKSKSKRLPSSIYIEHHGKGLLIDCTPYIKEQINRVTGAIDAILITHAHKDAIGGLKKLDKMLDRRVPLYAAEHTIAKLPKLKNIEPKRFYFGTLFELFDLYITPIAVEHSIQPSFDPTAGFRIENSYTLVYASDVGKIPKDSLKHFKNADLMILDAAQWKNPLKSHLTVEQALEYIAQFEPKKAYFTQIGHSFPPHEKARKIIRELFAEKYPEAKTELDLLYDGKVIDDKSLSDLLSVEDFEGLCLDEESAKQIWKGEKTLLVTGKFYDLTGHSLYLIGNGKCYGIIHFGDVKRINLQEFAALKHQHLISDDEREKLWPNRTIFYAYYFAFEPFKAPKKVRIQTNESLLMSDVKYLFEHNLIRDISTYDPTKLTTKVLLDDMRIAMAWWSSKKQGKKIPYSFEEIENILQLIIQELLKRGIKFHPEEMKPNAREVFERVMKRIREGKIFEAFNSDRSLMDYVINNLPEHSVYVELTSDFVSLLPIKESSTQVIVNDTGRGTAVSYLSASSSTMVMRKDPIRLIELFDSPTTLFFADLRALNTDEVLRLSTTTKQTRGRFLFLADDNDVIRGLFEHCNCIYRNGRLIITNYTLSDGHVPDFVSYVRDAILIKDFISLVGSSVEKDKYHDIDILIRLTEPSGFLKRAVETRLYKMFPEKIADKLHFIWGDAEGPHDTFVPLFDLELKALEPKVIKMSESIEPLRPFYPMKPKRRFYQVKKAIDFIFSKAPVWAAEKKYNGFRATIHKKGLEVKIFSDQAKDITFPFPTAVKQALAASDKDFIVDCELVPYKGKQPLGRDVAAKYIGSVKSHKDIDDSGVIFHVFDCLYYDGQDLTDRPWQERQKYLKKLKFGNNFKRVEPVIVSEPDEAYKAIRFFSNLVGSEGCMLKRIDGKYRVNGESDDWVKYRTLLPLRVVVLKANPVKSTDAHNYTVGIYVSKANLPKINKKYLRELNGKHFLFLGNTFNTSVVAKPGDILDILVEEVWRHRHKDGTIHYSIHKPNVAGISKYTKPSPLKELDAYVVGRGIEVEASETDTGDTEAEALAMTASHSLPVSMEKDSEGGEQIGEEPPDFPDRMQEGFRANIGKWKDFVIQWHYRGHIISDEERKRDNIPAKYKYRMKSLHADFRFEVNDHLEGITVLSPTSTDPSVPDLVNENMKNARAVLKAPQPKGWLKAEGIAEPGVPGSTRKAPAVFVIVGKGKYKPIVAEDHKIIVEFKPDAGKINEAIFKKAEKEGILIERKPGNILKKLPRFVSFHIAHIGNKHIILADGVKNAPKES